MRYITTALIWSISWICCQGQSFQEDFEKYLHSRDTINQLNTLEAWEQEAPDDPELLVAYFNFYVNKARKEVVALTTTPLDGEALVLKDSTGKDAGFLGSQIVLDPEWVEKGISKINQGIELYPERLDMRFGKIHMLGEIQAWERFTSNILDAIRYGYTHEHAWTWSNGVAQEDPETFFLSSIQDYILTLYNTEDDSLLANVRTIAQEVLINKPDHVVSLSNVSVTYLLTEKYKEAIEVLLKAEEIDPTDGIVLSNIAFAYRQQGDIPNSIKYYEKMLELDDPQAKEFATQMIEELKKE